MTRLTDRCVGRVKYTVDGKITFNAGGWFGTMDFCFYIFMTFHIFGMSSSQREAPGMLLLVYKRHK